MNNNRFFLNMFHSLSHITAAYNLPYCQVVQSRKLRKDSLVLTYIIEDRLYSLLVYYEIVHGSEKVLGLIIPAAWSQSKPQTDKENRIV